MAPRSLPSDVVDIRHGDALDVLRSIPAESVDACVTDPPYGLSEEPDMAEVLRHWLAGDDYTHQGGGFMGRTWDSFVPGPSIWREVYRVLRPGGYLLAFAGTRTSDLMGIAIRLAGFERRDTIRVETTGAVLPAELAWIHAEGFPKGINVSKAIDAAAGATREVIGHRTDGAANGSVVGMGERRSMNTEYDETAPATTEARQWDGWNTALKPSFEPVIVARKPLRGTIASNVVDYGTGALNIAATRVPGALSGDPNRFAKTDGGSFASYGDHPPVVRTEGRWPSNVVLVHTEGCVPVGTRKVRSQNPQYRRDAEDERQDDRSSYVTPRRPANVGIGHADPDGTETVEAWECVEGCPVAELDAQSGNRPTGALKAYSRANREGWAGPMPAESRHEQDASEGGASRFYPTFRYQAKARPAERPFYLGPVCFADSRCRAITDDMHPSVWPAWALDPDGACPQCGTPCGEIMHPTVKPVDLMRWLVRLVVPVGGTVVDPFAGTGTTGEAALLEEMHAILGDKIGAHIRLIEHRVRKYDDPHAMARVKRGERVTVRRRVKPVHEDHDLFAEWAS